MNLLLSAAFALLSVAFYLLARLMQENVSLVRSRRRTAAVMRRLKRDRDGRQISFEAACDELTDEFGKNLELQHELDQYRLEERERFGADATARLN